MTRPRTLFYSFAACTAALILFHHYGGTLWRPLLLKARGQQTVSDVTSRLENKIQDTFPEIRQLTDGQALAILAFKEERQLEVWKHNSGQWQRITRYPFTGYSGDLGPKLKQGDGQIPEGIYRIEYLNPNSSFHLSMKISYPNDFDRDKAHIDQRTQLGNDIFIHGMNASIGCIPIGNSKIEELFYLVAKNGYPNTKVIIAPYDMRVQTRPIEIDAITWENELYTKIADQLHHFSGS